MSERHLPTLLCTECGVPLAGRGARRATSFEDCSRRCESCGIGFSNALHSPTTIYRDPLKNIPTEARAGAIPVLQQALNVDNRPSKLAKFGFSTSEDAVTWAVFSFLASDANAMEKALGTFKSHNATGEGNNAATLLWGVPVGSNPHLGQAVRKQLIEVCDRLGESPRRRSEPDVIVDMGDRGLVIIEVKYKSKNDSQPDSPKFARYLDERYFRDPSAIRATGLYELTRNWRIGAELAGDRPFLLMNLGIPRDSNLDAFGHALEVGGQRRFGVVDWRSVVLPWTDRAPPWLTRFVEDRLEIPRLLS